MQSSIALANCPITCEGCLESDRACAAVPTHSPLSSVGQELLSFGAVTHQLCSHSYADDFQTQGEPFVCSDLRSCHRIFSEGLMRRGRWQREDISAYERICIAQQVYESDRPWGMISQLAQQYGLSRQSIYDIAGHVRSLFNPRPPGPLPCVGRLLPCWSEVKAGAREDVTESTPGDDPHRLILTALFPGGLSLRPIREILEEAHKQVPSLGALCNIIDQEGAKALDILNQIDYAGVSQDLILVDIDETFFDGYPFLLVVEPVSLAICGFYVPHDNDRSSNTWEPLLLCLQEDQHLHFYGGVGDGARCYPKTVLTVREQAQRFQEDVFHIRRDLSRQRRKLENRAYRAFGAEYRALSRCEKSKSAETEELVRQAQAESLRCAILHDAFEELCSRVADATEIIDLRSGEVRDREINLWLLNEAIAQMAALDHPEVVKMAKRLKGHRDRLLTCLDWLEDRLAPLWASLHAYLNDPALGKVVLQAVAREWRLEHEVVSHGRRVFSQAYQGAKQEAEFWIEGDAVLMSWREQVRGIFDWVQRASSAVECVNSILKPLLVRKKHFSNPRTAYDFLALFVLWHNLRVFKEGKRKGQSPFQILGIDLGEEDWRALLGYASLH